MVQIVKGSTESDDQMPTDLELPVAQTCCVVEGTMTGTVYDDSHVRAGKKLCVWYVKQQHLQRVVERLRWAKRVQRSIQSGE